MRTMFRWKKNKYGSWENKLKMELLDLKIELLVKMC